MGAVECAGQEGWAGRAHHPHAWPGIEQGTARGHCNHADGPVAALRGERGAIQRIDGNVHLGPSAVADALAAVKHGRLQV